MWPGTIKIPMEANLALRHMLKLSLFSIRLQETELSSTTPCPSTLLLPTILSILKFLTVRVYMANISSASKPEPMTLATSSPKLAWPDCISTKAPLQSQIPWSPQVTFLQHRCLQVPEFVSGKQQHANHFQERILKWLYFLGRADQYVQLINSGIDLGKTIPNTLVWQLSNPLSSGKHRIPLLCLRPHLEKNPGSRQMGNPNQ